jgi:hypothetical protein
MSNIVSFYIPPTEATTTANNYPISDVHIFQLVSFTIRDQQNDNIIFVSFDNPAKLNTRNLFIDGDLIQYTNFLNEGVSGGNIIPLKSNDFNDYESNKFIVRLRQINPDKTISEFTQHGGVVVEFSYK